MNTDTVLPPIAKVRLLRKAVALREYSLENRHNSSSSHTVERRANGTTVPLHTANPPRQKNCRSKRGLLLSLFHAHFFYSLKSNPKSNRFCPSVR